MTKEKRFEEGDRVYVPSIGLEGTVVWSNNGNDAPRIAQVKHMDGETAVYSHGVLELIEHDFYIGNRVISRGRCCVGVAGEGTVFSVTYNTVSVDFESVGKRHNLLPGNLAHISKKEEQVSSEKVDMTYTGKSELDDGRIVEIPWPDDSWKVESVQTLHRLACVEAPNCCLYDFEIHEPDKNTSILINHKEGNVWLKDMARRIVGSRCLEITTWIRKPIMHEIPQVREAYTDILKELR